MDAEHRNPRGDGYERLWRWFGLSYAGWLTLPRCLMHEMPDEWQDKMGALLEEYDEAFPNQPNVKPMISFRDGSGKFTKGPDWLHQYRYPRLDLINEMRRFVPRPHIWSKVRGPCGIGTVREHVGFHDILVEYEDGTTALHCQDKNCKEYEPVVLIKGDEDADD